VEIESARMVVNARRATRKRRTKRKEEMPLSNNWQKSPEDPFILRQGVVEWAISDSRNGGVVAVFGDRSIAAAVVNEQSLLGGKILRILLDSIESKRLGAAESRGS
jgi:hypothetical protein